MQDLFIEKPINIKNIQGDSPVDICLLENNTKQIGAISNFLQNDKKIFLMNGFLGSGKTSLLNFVISELKEDVLAIKYICFETTVLDDMLLSFFESFRNFVIQGKITQPKIKVENFNQKINAYFNYIDKPIVIVIDSYASILKNNKPDILNFIKYLSSLSNIKIILSSRVFNYDEFDGLDFEQTTVLAFSKEIFEKFLKNNDIKNIGVLSNELYKQTKGYYHYVNLSVKIMKLRDYNLVKFLDAFSKSLLTFPDFIFRDVLSMVDPVSLHLFRLLAIMRIPIHINLLKSLHLFNPQPIMFFIKNSLLYAEGESLYLPDYFRDIIDHQIQDSVQVKLHKACVELYETQLPLKPLERDLRLSRQTMRNEIDYHSLFIPKKPQLSVNTLNPVAVIQNQATEVISANELPKKVEETKEEQIKKINFIVEDTSLLDDIADSIVDFVNDKSEKTELVEKGITLSLTQLLNVAKQEENNYNFKAAIMLYQSALTKKDEDNFDTFLPTIYIKLANVYKNMSLWYEALEFYTKAQDYYSNISDEEKVCELKLEIANIYYAIYKYDNAKYILNTLDKRSDLSNELRIKVNLSLGKLSEKISEESFYYEKSLSLIDNMTDKSVCAELYYRYAVVCDEKNNPKTALMFYKKCIDVENNPKHNAYLAKSYANIAELYDEVGKSDSAIKYYKKSFEYDEITKNYNGLYNSSRNLAEIYASKDENSSLEYLLKARDYAKQLNEPFYMADICMEVGNFYLLRKDYDSSYKYFIEAYNIAKSSFAKDNSDKIMSKIEYLKNLMLPGDFGKLQDKYGR